MSERVAIVVGAGGELGRATAEKLAAAGFTVVGTDRSENGLKELPDGIRREVADPVDPVSARSVIDRIAAEVGPPEVLVNTIGMYHLGDALTATQEDLRLMIDVNVGPALWLTQAMVPYLRERGSGSIVHVAARPGLKPTAGMATYAVSKAALVHLTRVLDLELRPLGIRVNAVAPQLLDTAKNRPYLTPHLLAHGVAPGGGRRHHRLPRERRRRARQRCGRARLRRLSLFPSCRTPGKDDHVTQLGPEPSLVPRPQRGDSGRPRGRHPGRGRPRRTGVGRHPARLRADTAVRARPGGQRAGLLRRAGGEEPVLGHRRCLPGGFPDHPRRGRAVRRAPVDRAQPAARHRPDRRRKRGVEQGDPSGLLPPPRRPHRRLVAVRDGRAADRAGPGQAVAGKRERPGPAGP